MALRIFSVFDSKVGAYMQPFVMQSRGHAVRAFQNTANDPNTELSKWPEDFTLFEIGEFDEYTGQVTAHEAHVALGKALEFQRNAVQPTLAASREVVSQLNG